MTELPSYPECASAYTYEDGALLICPECAREWPKDNQAAEETKTIRDAVGNELKDGNKVKNIRLVPPTNVPHSASLTRPILCKAYPPSLEK